MPLDEHERKVVAPELEVPELGREPANHPFLINPNVLADVLAHLAAVYAGKSVLLKADAAGALMVNSGAGGGLTETIPVWLNNPPDFAGDLNAETGEWGSYDFGVAAERIVGYQCIYADAVTYVHVTDSDTPGQGTRKLFDTCYRSLDYGGKSPIVYAHTSGRYLAATGNNTSITLRVLGWDL